MSDVTCEVIQVNLCRAGGCGGCGGMWGNVGECGGLKV